MNINAANLEKADEALRQALKDSPAEEVLRAVLVVDAIRPAAKPAKPVPSAFPSGTAWRKAIIEQRQEWVERELGPTLKRLEELGLNPRGGFLGQVVVDGTPRQLLEALQLEGVKAAVLDFDIPILDLHDPREVMGEASTESHAQATTIREEQREDREVQDSASDHETGGEGQAYPEPGSTLLREVCSGSPEAWQRLVELFAPVVGRWCERAGLRYPDTGDVIQEVFRTTARRVGDFRRDRGSGSFVAFLWTVTRSRIVDHHRRSGREPEAVGGSDFQERLHQEPAPEDSSSEATPVEEQNVVIRRVLDLVRGQVAETTWEAFWRTVIDGQSPADVAAELGLSSAAAVYVACSRVKKRLRQQLEGLLD